MSIVGHGIDIVSVERIEQMLREHSQRFVGRCFTPLEQAYCSAMKKSAEHYAARFAAKEALLKALGKGLTDGIEWTDIEIRREPGGRPTLHVEGRAAEVAHALGATGFVVSLSHTDSHAIASVIAVAQ
jgi:holo-[acyl-carrier protein] synthase